MAWSSPKFPTECYFMCFHCHHLSIIPCYRQYTSCLRSLRDMNRMVEELESREKEWRDTPMAARNRMLQKKWKDRIKVKIVHTVPLTYYLTHDTRIRRVSYEYDTRILFIWHAYLIHMTRVSYSYDTRILFIWHAYLIHMTRVSYCIWHAYLIHMTRVSYSYDTCILFMWHVYLIRMTRVSYSYDTRILFMWSYSCDTCILFVWHAYLIRMTRVSYSCTRVSYSYDTLILFIWYAYLTRMTRVSYSYDI